MTKNDDDNPENKPPPHSIPPDFNIQMVGFDEDIANEAGSKIITFVQCISSYMPLNNLVGFTVAFDYHSALADIDTGFPNGKPAQATQDEELGAGVGMAMTVLREGILKTHIVLGAKIVELLISENELDVNNGYKLITHELAHAVDHELKRLAFGDELWLMASDEFIPDAKERYLWELSHCIWDEYYASRVSVIFGEEESPFEDELFFRTYLAFQERLYISRKKYHWRELSLEDFLRETAQNLRLLFMASGYVFGLADGKGLPLEEIAPKTATILDEKLAQAILSFRESLDVLWDRRGNWEDYDEFLLLNESAEVVLNAIDLYVRNTNTNDLHIDIPALSKYTK